MSDAFILARVLHVLGIVLWIGGVAMVTFVVLPAARRSPGGASLFEAVERRFSRIARGSTVIVGLSGFYMIWSFDLWQRFADSAYWWMHAMVAVWAIFTIVLFIGEPLLHRQISQRIADDPQGTFTRMLWLHRLLLFAALVTIAGAVAGAHGYQFR